MKAFAASIIICLLAMPLFAQETPETLPVKSSTISVAAPVPEAPVDPNQPPPPPVTCRPRHVSPWVKTFVRSLAEVAKVLVRS